MIPVSKLKGIGPANIERLNALHIETVQDVLFHLPLRYQDRTRITPIKDAKLGHAILIQGEVVDGHVMFAGKRSLVCRIDDGSASIQLRFFHFNQQQKQQLTQKGLYISCFGEVRQSYRGGLEMVHPEYRVVEKGVLPELSESLTPIYPSVKYLTQRVWQKITEQALRCLDQDYFLPELIPKVLLNEFNMVELVDALRYVHRPPPDANVNLLVQGEHPAQQRLAFEELVAQQLALHQLRLKVKKYNATALPINKNKKSLSEQFLNQLPFDLTKAQEKVAREIQQDLEKPEPMLRLVQGDVGSGKTVVAALAVLQAIEKNQQAAIMVPTEILAEQHYETMAAWFAPLGIKVGLLTGSLTGKKREAVLEKIYNGSYSLVIGTHALFQNEVEFKSLSLAVIDEQHRFGVHQRLSLKEKGMGHDHHPHQLIMTATPIPRTLAMTAYADLDVSVIDALPPGRKPVQTIALANSRWADVVERVRANCEEGRQAYWVCTLIEESETLQAQAAQVAYQKLVQALPGLRLGLIHGRLKAQEKDAIMQAVKRGDIDVLVATTVIEVGVNVPNATLMIIDNPERLGLAQLHQLRGRVGRGADASHCVLMYQSPLSHNAKQRLDIMRQHNDGFAIANEDLELRGPGEVLGTRQTGLIELRVADLLRDKGLLPAVKKVGKKMANDYADSVQPLIKRWLAGVERYGEV